MNTTAPTDTTAPRIEAELQGALGDELRRSGYRAHIVVERSDGAPMAAFDREAVDDITAAALERDARMVDAPSLGDLVMVRRIARGDARTAVREGKGKAPKPRAKGKRAAAKRPATR